MRPASLGVGKVAVLLAAGVFACTAESKDPTSTSTFTSDNQPSLTTIGNPGAADVGEFELCKHGTRAIFRVIIDSNHDCAVRIEGNNSERRYLGLNVSEAMLGKDQDFATLYGHINGPAMQAFMYDLLHHVPASAGGWNDVRTAPQTIARKQMFVEGLRASDKAFLRMLEDGEFNWRDVAHTFRITLGDGENRIPAKALDEWVRSHAGRFEADLRPGVSVWKRLFGVELDRPKGARATGERQTFDEGAEDAQYAWQPFNFNTPMYHLPSMTVIREMIWERTGREVGDGPAEAES